MGAIDDAFEACLAGTSQSPVDIVGALPAELPPLEFDYSAIPLVVENTDHVIDVPMSDDSDHTLTIGDEVSRLVQYHVHAPSEHTLEGESFDAEAHLVHQDDAGQLAVVAVLLDTDAPASALLDSIMTNAPAVAGAEAEVDEDWSPLDLVPVEGSDMEVSGYSTYTGSLTHAGINEGVRWIVLDDRLGRPTQPLNDREIERPAE